MQSVKGQPPPTTVMMTSSRDEVAGIVEMSEWAEEDEPGVYITTNGSRGLLSEIPVCSSVEKCLEWKN